MVAKGARRTGDLCLIRCDGALLVYSRAGILLGQPLLRSAHLSDSKGIIQALKIASVGLFPKGEFDKEH